MLFSWWAATQGAALQIHCLFICAGPFLFLSLALRLSTSHTHTHIIGYTQTYHHNLYLVTKKKLNNLKEMFLCLDIYRL